MVIKHCSNCNADSSYHEHEKICNKCRGVLSSTSVPVQEGVNKGTVFNFMYKDMQYALSCILCFLIPPFGIPLIIMNKVSKKESDNKRVKGLIIASLLGCGLYVAFPFIAPYLGYAV